MEVEIADRLATEYVQLLGEREPPLQPEEVRSLIAKALGLYWREVGVSKRISDGATEWEITFKGQPRRMRDPSGPVR